MSKQSMTKELKTAIDSLYSIFDKYSLKHQMECCPCCVSDSDGEKIRRRRLRDLDADDLSSYAFKAMTTWGGVEDFKHYLPRIFELLATTDLLVDTFVVLGKLEYGKWRTWDEIEQKSIKAFLLAWWSDLIRSKSYFDEEAFIEIYKLTGNIEEILSLWTLEFDTNSFLNYVNLVQHHYVNLLNKERGFRELKKEDADSLIAWVRKNAGTLEAGFFHFDESDKEMAERISNTQYIYESMA